ncbi:MAG: hypothetical protein ACKOWF_06390 [Chloroflexota bacterium]
MTRHAGGIYRKLGVSGRASAIEEARRLGIAPLAAAADDPASTHAPANRAAARRGRRE